MFPVLALEFFFRMWGLGSPLLYQVDPHVEYIAKPEQKIFRFWKNISTNDLGLRFCVSCSRGKHPPNIKRLRVVFMGDSVLFGGFVDDKHLATNLFALARPGLDILNVSSGSWGPANWLGWIDSRGYLDASYLILVLSSHDAFDQPTFQGLDPNIHPVAYPSSALEEVIFKYMPKIFPPYLKQQFALLQDSLMTSKRLNNQYRTVQNYRINPLHSSSRYHPDCSVESSPLEDLKCIITRAKKRGIPVAAVQFWSREELLSGVPSKGHDLITRVLAELEVPSLQSEEIFLKCLDGDVNPLFIDNIHPYTDDGQSCLFQTLETALGVLE